MHNKSRLKVLHINSEKSWRGGEQQMTNLIHELNSLGVQSSVCCRKNSKLDKYTSKEKISSLCLSFSGLKFFNAISLKKFVLKEKFDLIHTHSSNAQTLVYYASLLGLKTPVISSKRTDFPVKSKGKYNFKSLKYIICVSNKIKEITRRSVNNPDIVQTVYSGIDLDRFEVDQKSLKQKLGLEESEVLIGNTSAIAPQKDYPTFLTIAKNLPEFQFVIIGDGPMEQEIKGLAKKMQLKNIHFTGFLKELEVYMKSLNCFLITSETEGLGTSILDAMIAKIPVVGTNAGGIPEIVINNKTGLLCEIRNTLQITNAVTEILNNEELRSQLVKNAHQNISENFSRRTTATRTFEFYQKAIS